MARHLYPRKVFVSLQWDAASNPALPAGSNGLCEACNSSGTSALPQRIEKLHYCLPPSPTTSWREGQCAVMAWVIGENRLIEDRN